MVYIRNSLLIVVLFGLLLQAGCGFRLRGAVELPASLQQLQVIGVDAYSDLGLAMSQAWGEAGAQLSYQAVPQRQTLKIVRQDFTRRVLAVDNAGRPTAYELKFELQFAVLDETGKVLVRPQTVSMLRDYRFDPDNVLSKGDEEARIKRDMIRLAVSQMQRRLSAQLHPSSVTTIQDETAR